LVAIPNDDYLSAAGQRFKVQLRRHFDGQIATMCRWLGLVARFIVGLTHEGVAEGVWSERASFKDEAFNRVIR